MILIVSAIKLEILATLKRMKKLKVVNKKMPLVYEGYINNKQIILVISGMGKGNASAASKFISSKFLVSSPGEKNKKQVLEKIIICGVSGALKESLSTGDVMICDKILLRDLKSFRISGTIRLDNSEKAIERVIASKKVLNCKLSEKESKEKFEKNKLFFSGSLLTVCNMLTDVEEKKLAGERFNADVADMESYWLLKNVNDSKVKINNLCVRAVVDDLRFRLPESLKSLIINENINYCQVIFLVLKNPVNFFRLVSTGINFRKACRSLNFFIEKIL